MTEHIPSLDSQGESKGCDVTCIVFDPRAPRAGRLLGLSASALVEKNQLPVS